MVGSDNLAERVGEKKAVKNKTKQTRDSSARVGYTLPSD